MMNLVSGIMLGIWLAGWTLVSVRELLKSRAEMSVPSRAGISHIARESLR